MKTKNKKAISTLIAVAVALSILVAFSATASATDINVPGNQHVQRRDYRH
jgi:cell division septal protein FtsQ